MEENRLVRFRIRFIKTSAMRFTGHLDLYRAWERTIRRARLPLAYSQGYNPHPRINLACALPLGFTSEAEIVDIWLEAPPSPAHVAQAIEASLPPGIQLKELQVVDLRQPALQSLVDAAEYVVTLMDDVQALSDRIDALLSSEKLPRVRRKKSYDLRPLIELLHLLSPDEHNGLRLFMRLSAKEGATGRPEEVLEELGIPAHTALVHRTKLLFSEPVMIA